MVFVAVATAILLISWLGIVLVGPPYVPTLARELEKLLDELPVSKDDYVVDLGSGDGRVLVAAAKHGARGSGVELNPFLVVLSWLRLRRYSGVGVRFGNIWRYKLPPETTLVFVFFAGSFMAKLDDYLVRQAAFGRTFRLVSFGFTLPGRTPERKIGAFHIYSF